MVRDWKVILHEAPTAALRKDGAKEVDRFSVQGDGIDGARRSARKWLVDKGYDERSIRSINASASQNQPMTLIAYVAPGAPAAAKLKSQADYAKRKGLR